MKIITFEICIVAVLLGISKGFRSFLSCKIWNIILVPLNKMSHDVNILLKTKILSTRNIFTIGTLRSPFLVALLLGIRTFIFRIWLWLLLLHFLLPFGLAIISFNRCKGMILGVWESPFESAWISLGWKNIWMYLGTTSSNFELQA